MTNQTAATTPRRPWRMWAAFGLAAVLLVGIPWGCSAAQRAQWDAESGTHEVSVRGDLVGDGYEIADVAEVETWAEHSDMVVRLDVTRTSDLANRTPLLAVEIGDNQNRCETARSWMWSTSEGSTVDLRCLASVDIERLREIDSVQLVPYAD